MTQEPEQHPAGNDPGRRPAPASTVFGQVYVIAAVLLFVSSFLPLWAPGDPDDRETATMSLWKAMVLDGGGFAVMGLVLLALLCWALIAAAHRGDRSLALPLSAAGLCLPALLLLITKPDSGSPKPDLGVGGGTMMAVVIVVLITVAVQVSVPPPSRRSVPAGARTLSG